MSLKIFIIILWFGLLVYEPDKCVPNSDQLINCSGAMNVAPSPLPLRKMADRRFHISASPFSQISVILGGAISMDIVTLRVKNVQTGPQL